MRIAAWLLDVTLMAGLLLVVWFICTFVLPGVMQ